MRLHSGLCIALFMSVVVRASASDASNWHTGELTLAGNQIVERPFSYDPVTDLLQVRENGVVKVYSARQVHAFSYFDVVNNVVRSFISLSFSKGSFRPKRMFFESVVGGEMRVVRRPRSGRVARMMADTPDELWHDSRSGYEYYICQNNRFVPLRQFHKGVLKGMLQEFGETLTAYIRRHRLNLHTQRGCLRLITQYNLLKNPATACLF